MLLEFYDINSPLGNITIEDKSNCGHETDIVLCDDCLNIILKPYNKGNNKLICPKCLEVYNPHYELVKVQDTETTIDELSAQGEISFHEKVHADKIRKTLNHSTERLEDIECVAMEFERYKEIEIIDKDTITGLNKTRRRTELE
jgi:DNA-directed RNA polymerase subunit M/transcription elongation factor TFIIS